MAWPTNQAAKPCSEEKREERLRYVASDRDVWVLMRPTARHASSHPVPATAVSLCCPNTTRALEGAHRVRVFGLVSCHYEVDGSSQPFVWEDLPDNSIGSATPRRLTTCTDVRGGRSLGSKAEY